MFCHFRKNKQEELLSEVALTREMCCSLAGLMTFPVNCSLAERRRPGLDPGGWGCIES